MIQWKKIPILLLFILHVEAWWRNNIGIGGSPWRGSVHKKLPEQVENSLEVPLSPRKLPEQVRNDLEEECVCVEPLQCDAATKRIITDGTNAVDFRNQRRCSPDKICCLLPFDSSEESLETTDAPRPTSATDLSCGMRLVPFTFKLLNRVAGEPEDTETIEGEFPWTLVIQQTSFDEDDSRKMICGASLIRPNVALTAAHCVEGKDPETLSVAAGEFDLSSDDEKTPVQESQVVSIINHPKYSRVPVKNDIAILVLDTSFELNESVNTICLPNEEDNIKWQQCVAVGWGAKGNSGDLHEDRILRKAAVDVVPRKKCINQLRETILGKYFKLHSSFLCAGGDSKTDTCEGDGGGPYVCSDANDRYYQLGITSWGVGCATKGIPGLYTDTAKMFDWITDTLQDIMPIK